MSEIILYPTETIYALGVNPFDRTAWHALCELKGRIGEQTASWLVRSVEDIEQYAEITPQARALIDKHLPGPLTIVLKAKASVPKNVQALNGTVSFRISSDKLAQEIIARYMKKYHAPLTCTSANPHGQPTRATPQEIVTQFGERASMISEIFDDGPRHQPASTIVRCVGDSMTILRQGSTVL